MEPAVAAKILDHLEKARSSPRSAETWGKLGEVLQAHGLAREASECYLAAIDLSPREFPWHYLRAHALRGVDAALALAQTEEALRLDPAYAAAHVLKAEIREQQGETEKALASYEKALELEPTSAIAAFGAGRLSLSQGNLDRARALLEAAAGLAQLYRRLGEDDKARAEAETAFAKKAAVGVTDPIHFRMTQESVSSLVQLERAAAASEAGDFRRAEEIYRGLVELRPDDADLRARYGDVLVQVNQTAKAREEYLGALGTNPAHAAAHHGLGNLRNLEGDFEGALSEYRASLESRPDHVPTLVNFGALLAFQGKGNEAEAAFRRALEIEPTAFGPNRQLGELLLKRGDVAGAIRHFRAALEAEPDSGPVHFQLAMALASTEQFGPALEHARKASALGHPVKPDVLSRLEAMAARGGGR